MYIYIYIYAYVYIYIFICIYFHGYEGGGTVGVGAPELEPVGLEALGERLHGLLTGLLTISIVSSDSSNYLNLLKEL